MSILAGYDIVIEVSPQSVLEIIKANGVIDGESINPPFEMFVPMTVAGVAAVGHIIVRDLALFLDGDADVRLVFVFENSSIVIHPPLSRTISLLDGTIDVKTTIELVDLDPPGTRPQRRTLSANLGVAKATLNFSSGATARIASSLAGSGIPPATFADAAQQMVEQYIRGVGRWNLPLVFPVDHGFFGSIKDGIFESLEVHNILGHPAGITGLPAFQAIGLFGQLLPGVPPGDHALKPDSSIAPGHDIALSISARAFHRLSFCPSLAAPLKMSVEQLPPSCGSGGGIDRDGVKLTNLTDTFENNKIVLTGSAEKSGTCYDAYASFRAEVTMSMSGSAVVGNTVMGPVTVTVDIPWYCSLAAVVGGPIGWIIAAVVSDNIDDSAKNVAAMTGVGGSGLTFTTGGFHGTQFDDVSISPEGLTLQGVLPQQYLPYPKKPGISIEGSVTLDSYTGAAQGVYHCELACLAGDYGYTEYGQAQVGTYVPVPTMLGSPLALEWYIEKIDGSWSKFSPVTLATAAGGGLTGAGTIVLDNVYTQYPTPLPNGIEVTQDVHVAYDVKTAFVTLKNNAGEGCFRVKLSVVATDPAGHVATGYTYVYFYGDVVQMEDGYQEKLAQCIRQWIHAVESHHLQGARVPPWVPVNYPRPDELVDFLRFMQAENSPQAQQLLPHVKLAHGTSDYRATFSVAAGETMLLDTGRTKGG